MPARIITVTLNPAIDETITLDSLTPGRVHRARGVTHHAGGKGVNVASCLADWGAKNLTVSGFLGAENAGLFEALCARKGLTDHMVRLPGATRTNIKLSHDGETTDINTPGLAPGREALTALTASIAHLAGAESIILLAGSLPPGVPADFYAAMIANLKPSGARIVLDTSGAPLAAALRGGAPVFCVKPNRAELEEYAGKALASRGEIAAAAARLRETGIALVAVSLGAEGALFAGRRMLHAALPAIRAASTVGAGDAMVAGMIAAMADRADEDSCARLATAFAVGKLSRPGPNLPARDVITALAEQVQITILEEPKK